MHFIKKKPEEKRLDFDEKLKSKRILRIPGAYNPLTAKLIEEIGYDGIYVSGGVMSNDLGYPDIGLTTLKDVSYRSNQIARVTNLPTLVKTLAEAWAREDIRVNGIAPGFVATKLTEVTFKDKNRYESSLKSIPLARWGEAEDIGLAACFLASNKASYITGQMITVDGGLGLS